MEWSETTVEQKAAQTQVEQKNSINKDSSPEDQTCDILDILETND